MKIESKMESNLGIGVNNQFNYQENKEGGIKEHLFLHTN